MPRAPSPFPAALEEFVRLFNEEAFWDSHEVLEEPWRETGSEFYHGLILYASALVHVQRGNPHGIRAQFAKAGRCLQPFRPSYLGIDLEGLLHAQEGIREGVGVPGDDAISFPSIQLQAEYLRGDEPELVR